MHPYKDNLHTCLLTVRLPAPRLPARFPIQKQTGSLWRARRKRPSRTIRCTAIHPNNGTSRNRSRQVHAPVPWQSHPHVYALHSHRPSGYHVHDVSHLPTHRPRSRHGRCTRPASAVRLPSPHAHSCAAHPWRHRATRQTPPPPASMPSAPHKTAAHTAPSRRVRRWHVPTGFWHPTGTRPKTASSHAADRTPHQSCQQIGRNP